MKYDFSTVSTPAYVVDEASIRENLRILQSVIKETGCKILLAQKAFSMFRLYPLIKEYLHGTTASSLFEAKLGYEEMGGEVHIFAPAFKDHEFDEILRLCDHIVFNSYSQWERFKDRVASYNLENPYKRSVSCGLRINPEYSEIETDMYNPCFPGSRFGMILSQLEGKDLTGIEGLHFHTMCEQNSDVLARTLEVIEAKFGSFLKKIKWLNFGGGHLITRKDYDLDLLVKSINHIKEKYQIEVYLEPGEAIAHNGGWLVSSVLDTMINQMDIAILDTSAACHMPDVLEMPYRPYIIDSGAAGEYPYSYRLGGPTCLSGDVIGDYSFQEPLRIGDRLVFCDMAIYSMVKNNTFNGINLPSIYLRKEDGTMELVKHFGYDDFKNRLS